MAETVTVSLYLEDDGPTLADLRDVAARCGVSFDMFVTQALLHWALVRPAEIAAAPPVGPLDGLDPLPPASRS